MFGQTESHRWFLSGIAALTLIFQFSLTPEIRNTYRNLTNTIKLPPHIENNLIDREEYFKLVKENHHKIRSVTPFYWHVAKAGGTSVQNLYLKCYTLITASEIGIKGHEEEDFLRIVHANGSTNHMNVDVSTKEGIMHAQDLHLVQSHIPQLIFSPLFDETTEFLFDGENPGIMFAMFRDPVERVISLFYYLQEATWEPTYNPELKDMTLLEYVNSPLVEANFVTRSLLNKFTGPLSPEELNVAKEILRRKCIIGIVEDMEESLAGFDASLDFEPNLHVFTEREDNDGTRRDYVKSCMKEVKDGKGSNKHSHRKVDKDSEEYKILERKNGWDVTLWKYIQELYKEQKVMLQPTMEKKRKELSEIY